MKADALKRLEAEAQHPEGVAARIDSTELLQLLDERSMLLDLAGGVKDSSAMLHAAALIALREVSK